MIASLPGRPPEKKSPALGSVRVMLTMLLDPLGPDVGGSARSLNCCEPAHGVWRITRCAERFAA